MIKKFNKLIVFMVVLSMILNIGSGAMEVFATGNYPDTITVTKEAKPVDDECRTYEVELNINGVPPIVPLDIVLVIDRSGSMSDGSGKKPMAYAIEAANSFAQTVLGNNNDSIHRISVISFSGPTSGKGKDSDAKVERGSNNNKPIFSNKKSDVKSYIDGLTASGGTNTEAALKLAKTTISGARPEAKKVVIFMSDGVPTVSIGNNFGPQHPASGNNHITAANNAANALKLVPGISVFSIGLLNGINTTLYPSEKGLAEGVLNNIQNAGYYDATSGADLTPIYNAISTQMNESATNAIVTDKIGNNFELVPGSISVFPAGRPVSYDSGTKTITWEPGIVSTNAKLKYKVVAKSDYPGGEDVPTNEWAKLTYTNLNGVSNTNNPLLFPVPLVDVPGKEGSIEIIKELYAADGQTRILEDDTIFTFNVNGPDGYQSTVTASVNNPGLVENLVKNGQYTITEVDLTGYSNMDEENSKVVNLTINHCADENHREVTFRNKKDLDLGSATITKVLNNADNETIEEIRTFTVTITGPSFPEG